MAYVTPATVQEACSKWAESSGAFYLAGGTDLLPQMRQGRHAPELLVDLKRIDELKEIRLTAEGKLSVGAAVPLARIARNETVKKKYPILAECALAVGSYPLRNRATMAGNICNASPAADTAAALLALDAEVVVKGPTGGRTIAIGDFFLGPGKPALKKGELVTEVSLPAETAGCVGRYLRLSRRRAVDLATVAVLVARHASGSSHRVCLVATAPTPKRAVEAEKVFDQEGLGSGAARRAAEAAVAASSPIDDVRGTATYRRKMVSVLTERAAAELTGEER
jgi:carbon-monoxide dehydrogenase medium subunit